MFFGELETRNYQFRTLADSVEQVLINLRAVWNYHASDTPNAHTWEFLEDSVRITPLALGDTWTDCLVCENLAHTKGE